MLKKVMFIMSFVLAVSSVSYAKQTLDPVTPAGDVSGMFKPGPNSCQGCGFGPWTFGVGWVYSSGGEGGAAFGTVSADGGSGTKAKGSSNAAQPKKEEQQGSASSTLKLNLKVNWPSIKLDYKGPSLDVGFSRTTSGKNPGRDGGTP